MEKLQQLLLLHTIGAWSHWGALAKVELIVPSRLEQPLRLQDIPGFGDVGLDPFRQSLVTEALQKPVSMLALVLKGARLEDDANPAAVRLDKLGICARLYQAARHPRKTQPRARSRMDSRERPLTQTASSPLLTPGRRPL